MLLGDNHPLGESAMAGRTKRCYRTTQDLESRGLPDLLAQGMTRRQAAETLSIHPSTVDKWCQKHHWSTGRTGPRAGPGHPNWKGGRQLDKHGYVLVWVPLHPHSRLIGYYGEHRLLAEILLWRYLHPAEVVDHIDDWPYHNWPQNLRLFPSNADHLAWTTSYRLKSTPRALIPGAYKSPQTRLPCPDISVTLAQCSAEIRQRLDWHIESHRPRIEHQTFARRSFRRAGAWRNPFPRVSTD